MTTIAYKNGVLAADSQTTFGNIRATSDPKIIELHPNLVLACAGSVRDCQQALIFFSKNDWRENLDNPPETKKLDGIIVIDGKPYYLSGSCFPIAIIDPMYACGSGGDLALAAMKLGMSAPDAVVFASSLDIYTNDKVQVVYVQDQPKEAKAKRTRRTTSGKTVPKT